MSDAADRWRDEVRRTLPQADAELTDEIAQHAADRWASLRARGLAADECDRRIAAEIEEWGGARLPARAPRWGPRRLWQGWTHDTWYAARTLRSRPAFAVWVILLTAIAVAINVTAFAVVYGILWRPLAYPDADRLTVLWQVRKGEQGQVSYPDFADVAALPVFDAAAAIGGGRGSLRIGDAIERVNMIEIEAQGYAMLGARPVLGRLLGRSDGSRPHVMISHRLWTGALASDPAILGRQLWISGRHYTVVGVLQPRFDFELPIAPSLKLEKQDLWTVFDPAGPFVARRDVTTYEALLRLAPGRTFSEAEAAVEAVAQRLASAHPSTNGDRSLRLASLAGEVRAPARRPMRLVAAAALATIVIALANLAMLALVRAARRGPELAIRAALGAGAWRLRRQVFTEAAMLAAAGTALGVAGAQPLVRAVASSDVLALPRADAIVIDAPVIVSALAIAVLVMAVLAAAPALRGTTPLHATARVAGRSSRRGRQLAVSAELALALVFCSAALLLTVSVVRLLAIDPGFDARGVVAVRVSTYVARYPALDDVRAFFTEAIARVAALPGVAAAAAGSSLPLSGQTSGTGVVAHGQEPTADARLSAGWQFVTPQYFEALGMRLVSGRTFTADDQRNDGHVTVINEDLARRLFPDRSPLGARIGVGGGERTGDWHEIVGVVRDVRHHALDAAPAPRVYDLFGEHWGRTLFVVARGHGDDAAAALVHPVRRTVAGLDPEAPVFDATTMEALLRRSAGPRRAAAALGAGLGAASLLLALIGVYAVTSASVAERTREIGIRAALGAGPADLVRLVAREGGATVALGAAAGIVISVAAAGAMRTLLFGISMTDSAALTLGAGALLVLGALGAVLPAARRAAATEPVSALRAD